MNAADSQSIHTFQVNKDLLNPNFEAYRLVSEDHDASIRCSSYRLPLPTTLAQLNPSTDGPALSYKELKDRLTQEKLIPGSVTGHLAYIDDDRFLVLVVLSPESHRPTFHPLYNLSPQTIHNQGGLPSIHALPGGRWLAADGSTKLTVLASRQVGRRWTADVVKVYDASALQSPSFRILDARYIAQATLQILIQAPKKVAQTTESKRAPPTNRTVFHVSLIEVSTEPSVDTQEIVSHDHVKWIASGDEAAYYASLNNLDGATLIAEEPFAIGTLTNSPAGPSSSTLPTLESQGTSASQPKTPEFIHTPQPRPPLFSWLQTPDSLTVVFQLPPQLSKQDFRVHFSPQGLSLSLASSALDVIRPHARIVELTDDQDEAEQSHHAESPEVRLAEKLYEGNYRSRALWGPIDPASSVWTWEHVGRSEKDRKGILTLYLEKKDEGTRWLKVFERSSKAKRHTSESVATKRKRPMIGGASSATKQDDASRLRESEVQAQQQAYDEHAAQNVDDEDEDDPPETLDPSELLTMVESLDKYTAPEGSGFDDDPHPRIDGPDVGFGKRESLLHDQLEPEDAVVGKKLRLTTVSSSSSPAERREYCVDSHPDTIGLWTLSSPLPENNHRDDTTISPLAVRKDLDGLVFLPPSVSDQDGEPAQRVWKHVDTLPALSFVLASKRDLNRVYLRYAPPLSLSPLDSQKRYDSIVLAFESPPAGVDHAPTEGHAGNLFVYYGQRLSRADGTGGEASAGSSKHKYASSRVIRLDAGGGSTGEVEDVEGAVGAGAGAGSSGSLMGVAVVKLPKSSDLGNGTEEEVLVCLCERKLLLLRGVL